MANGPPNNRSNTNNNQKKQGPSGPSFWQWLGIAALLFLLMPSFCGVRRPQNEITFFELKKAVTQNQNIEIKRIEFTEEYFLVTLAVSNKEYWLQDHKLLYESFSSFLDERGIKRPSPQSSQGILGFLSGTIFSLLPFLLIGLFIWMIIRQQSTIRDQAGNTFNFLKSKVRIYNRNQNGNRVQITFADVAGCDEAKQELQEVVEFLKNPEPFMLVGAKMPKGILLIGPPGCGKTLLARATAGEANVPFFVISASEFVELFVGVGAARVRDLFDQAKRNAPCVLFIDELDAVARSRGAGLGSSHDEREQTLNQILVEMDGFEQGTRVFVLAATNRYDILDPALIRPGRFDRQIVVDQPNIKGRRAILELHTKGKLLDPDVKLDRIAKQTTGFSGADLANLVNEAAILIARKNKKEISMEELSEAIDRVWAGPQRKSKAFSPREKRIVAYHEGGHATVAANTPEADPLQKISIVARGMAGGYTKIVPEEDRYLLTQKQIEAQITVAFGGLVAEEMILDGQHTTGPHNDLEQATDLARKMVMRFGMSALGPRTFGKQQGLLFLGKEITEQKDYSEATAQKIDDEVAKILTNARTHAEAILKAHKQTLELLVKHLLVEETLEGDKLHEILNLNGQLLHPNQNVHGNTTLQEPQINSNEEQTPLS